MIVMMTIICFVVLIHSSVGVATATITATAITKRASKSKKNVAAAAE